MAIVFVLITPILKIDFTDWGDFIDFLRRLMLLVYSRLSAFSFALSASTAQIKRF